MYWLKDESQANVDDETGALAEGVTPQVVAECEGYKLTEGVDLFRAKCDLVEYRCEPVHSPFTTVHALPVKNGRMRRNSVV